MSQRHVALVTGASRGIGLAISSSLREHGVRVLAPSRLELDLSSPASIDSYLKTAKREKIDIVVNNAGINIPRAIEDLRDAEIAEAWQTNLAAPFSLMRALTPFMRKQGWGRIVNLSSVFSLVTKKKRTVYSTTKAALNGLTRAFAVELASDGVLVNAVCPGYVDTELTRKNNSPADLKKIAALIPLGRMASPSEIARFIAFLCSEENSYITGQTLVIDGGFTCL